MGLIFRDCMSRIRKETNVIVSEIEVKLDDGKNKLVIAEALKKVEGLLKIEIKLL